MRAGTCSAILISLLTTIPVSAQSPDLPGDVELSLSDTDQVRLGLETVRLQAAQAPESVQAVGRVLDVTALAMLEAEIESASAVAEASASDAQRTKMLADDDQNASRQVLESALAQSRSDAARLEFARRRVALEWGTGLAKLTDPARQKLIDQIVAGGAALIRVDPLHATAETVASVNIRLATNSPPMSTDYLGNAGNTDPRLQTTGLLVILRGESARGILAGRVVAAEIESGIRLVGVLLPRESLIRTDGRTWAYLNRGGTRFVRREVAGARLLAEGWFVASDFAPGDDIVAAGSGSLLAVERSDEAIEAE